MTPLSRSYVHGASEQPLNGETVGRCFDRVVDEHGSREALVCRAEDIRWTWRELAARVDDFAAGLLALGLERGDRIAVWAQNRSEWVITQFAAAKAGLVLVNINPAARQGELREYLNQVGARALVVQDRFKTSDYLAMLADLLPELTAAQPGRLRAQAVPSLEIVVRLGETEGSGLGMLRFDEVLRQANDAARRRLTEAAEEIDFDDPVNIQFSSASGGKPAGATLTHHNIVNNGYFIGETLRLTSEDRICVPVPLFHCFGMVMGNMACLTHGSTIVYPGESFDPEQALATVAAERCSGLYGVPAMFIAMLEHENFADYDLGSLRTGIMAGAPCPIETMRQVVADMHMEQVTIAYGMTETSPVSFMSDVDDALERRVSTVGTIRPHTEVKIVDAAGRIVPAGEVGELCVRGYNVMRGYWGEPERTAQVIDAGGWMHTGDLAKLDADGYCNIVGGVKNVVIRGGENVYPVEIEEFLAKQPGVAEAVVFGVPDQRLGEEVCACVRLQEGASLDEASLRERCRGEIAHYKVPRYFRFFESFPASSGGALKFMLREKVIAELGLEAPQTA
ncbi:3-[(3aS,4S,7aS)-7a-methyl-1,5-dioxo-octahydro-1H-inden-4-yl]propanoyl:CoA ligase [wastewater metagenome]|uniref:3-[(3aS,4S,7aS)-7a-methyl-1, 5-dioxo-octahydro-1H-inden-4-yl]propanoyl:CoA ligase n=2 Tax=unclassified sequences TaxID=12908 RepID=A0A5B8RJ78_9ZZZZ|nr:AMP-binding protein [Arhodomonas sp. KWT]QEA06867.1 3-[(3aS,4S,7aS)-7a-methyl-1,5-dioxo-octahydro-1H-inden-4-yl]propanoyl:CoA ligase [uncultured organism]